MPSSVDTNDHPATARPAASVADLPIPAIDLDTTTPAELVDHLHRHACVLVTAGHGIPADLWWRTIELSKEFFALDDAAKAPAAWNGEGPWLGYLPVGSTDPAGAVPKLLEKFELQLDNPWRGDPDDVAGRAAPFPYWPAQPDGFVEAWVRMYAALGALAERVVAMLMEGLDLPGELRDAWTTNHFANLVVNNYIAQAEAPVDGQTRLTGHVDIGGVTLLSADEAAGGLEIQVDGEWVPVVLPPNSFLIQVGDLLRRWTNNVIPGNMHRVVNPPPEVAATAQRVSLVYFHYPAPDTVVEPAPSCRAADDVDRTPLQTHDHMMYRQRREQYEGRYDDEFV